MWVCDTGVNWDREEWVWNETGFETGVGLGVALEKNGLTL